MDDVPGRLTERVAAILVAHTVHPWPGPIIGPGRFTIRCPRCGILAASDYGLSPLVVGSAHQAVLVMAAIAGS